MTAPPGEGGPALVAARALLCAGLVTLAPVAATAEASARPTPAASAVQTPAATATKPPLAPLTATAAPALEATFRVRQALVGEGFELGASGRLLVASSGVSFTADGDATPSWTVSWRDLAAARAADGLWDSPSPLVIVERSERRHFIARIDRNGRHLSGEPLLLEIADGQRRFRDQGAPGSRIPAGPRIEKGEPNR